MRAVGLGERLRGRGPGPALAAALTAGLLLGLAASCAAARAGPPWQRFEYRQVHMGVQARIVLWSDDPNVARDAARAAFAVLARCDAALSDYRVDGEVARLCASAGEGDQPISEELAACLDRALEVARASAGAFDPTLGALTKLWRAARASGVAPSAADLAAARARCGWRSVHLDVAARRARIDAPGVELDFGGIGKGFGADRALLALGAHGIDRAMVAVAGDIALGAAPPGRTGWRIAWSDAAAGGVLELARCGVSTSGDAEQAFDAQGRRESHVLDARSGRGVVGRPQVTVIAPDATTADALATALSAAPAEDAARLLGAFPEVHIAEPPVSPPNSRAGAP